jgi:hypothetical protein
MQNELKDFFMKELSKLTKEVHANNHTVESVNKRVSTLTTRLEQLERNPPKNDGTKDEEDSFDDTDHPEDIVYFPDGTVDHKMTSENRAHCILAFNTRGMRGKGSRYNNGKDDPYAKVKFTIPAFYGRYDAEEYLDWEMTVEQKFASHLVPDHHKVRQATSEFKDFAIIWWQECASLNIQLDSWDSLKIAMRDRFVPASYKRDLRKKLQRLEQGDEGEDDEDITPLDANNIPGPITRARARQSKLEVSSFLKPSFYTFENRLLPNDYIVIRNKGEDQNMHGKGLGGVEVQQEGARHGGDPNKVDFESVSESGNSLS